MRVLDTRSIKRGYPLHHCVRFVTIRESIRASSFLPEQEAYLLSLSYDDAIHMVAGAVPGKMLYTMYTAMIDQELSSMALLHDAGADTGQSFDALIDCSCQEAVPDDTSLLMMLGNDLLQAVDHDDSTHADGFLDLLHTVDFREEEPHDSGTELLLGFNSVEDRETIAQLLEAVLDVPEPTDDMVRADTEPEPSVIVKAASKSGRISVTKDKWPRQLTPGEPGYTQAFVRANVFHRTHHCSNDAMERMALTGDNPPIKPGDSRYVLPCADCMQKRDSIIRHHFTPGASSKRLPDGLLPGQRFMIDGGDATVRAAFGHHRYFLVFICCKSAKKIIYYMRDNSARSFVAAVLYVRRLVRSESS